MSEDTINFKTGMIGFTMIFLGFLFFLFKIEACKSSPQNCQDTFHETNEYEIKCHPGATAEFVKEPKLGIMCHCPRSVDAGASSAL